MRNFRRCIWFSWPYRRRLVASIVCALIVAGLWSVNLSLIFPVLKLLSSGKNLQQWVDKEIADHQKAHEAHAKEVEKLNNTLAGLEAEEPKPVEREKLRRGYSASLAINTEQQDYHAAWAYRYQWLRAKVVRHLPQDPFDTFLWIIVAVLGCVVLKGAFEFLHESLVGYVTNRSVFDLRNVFFRRVMRQDVRQLSAAGTVDLMSRFATDTEQVAAGLKVLYGRVIAEPLKASACFIAACIISWQLTLLFVVIVPLALYILTKVSKAMRKAAKRALERISAMSKILREALDGVRVVKGFTREAHERRRFRTANREYFRKAMRLVNLDAFANPAIEVLVVLAVSLALLGGVYLVLTGNTHIAGLRMCTQPLSFETLLQFYVFLAAIADPVRKLSSVYAKLQAAEAAGARIFEVYDREPKVEANPDGTRLVGVAKGVEFRHVCFAYNPAAEAPTLDNVSFTVRAGETIAVVGGNGCGKTTLLSLLPRFFDPDSGAVLIDGVNLRTAHLRSLRKLIGVVTQDTQLFDDTVFANIAYGRPGATLDEVIEAAKKARAHDFIEKKEGGYNAMLGVAGSNFAGGERQKVALARAILRDPRILILDEFTSAVDAQSEVDIHATLKEFVRGRTTFLITHKLHTVPEIAGRVVMMEAGRVLDVGTHTELVVRCDPYRRLFESAQSWRQDETKTAPVPTAVTSGGSSHPPPAGAKVGSGDLPLKGGGQGNVLTSPLEGEVAAGCSATAAGGGGAKEDKPQNPTAPLRLTDQRDAASGTGEEAPPTTIPAPLPEAKPTLPEQRDAA